MNTAPLLQVKREILEDPASLVMETYFSPCGTEMCIAGRLVWNAGWRQIGRTAYVDHEDIRETGTVEGIAAQILEVSLDRARLLFHLPLWRPLGRGRDWLDATPVERAKIAAFQIDQFILGEHVGRLGAPIEDAVVEELEACAVA